MIYYLSCWVFARSHTGLLTSKAGPQVWKTEDWDLWSRLETTGEARDKNEALHIRGATRRAEIVAERKVAKARRAVAGTRLT